jgi:hypothetical protein
LQSKTGHGYYLILRQSRVVIRCICDQCSAWAVVLG